MKNIYFVVNNELNFDQRMIRICDSLASHNYNVFLVGKSFTGSLPLVKKKFRQRRLKCVFKKGKLAYLEINLKLFFYLLSRKPDILCAIDLDTIFPVLLVSIIKNCTRIYDAHELFTEMKEVVSRPAIQRLWSRVEQNTVPRFALGYTVSESIAQYLKKRYFVKYEVIRNIPLKLPEFIAGAQNEKWLLYQGSVNHGRCLEYLIPAMKDVNARLFIYGDGNFMEESRRLVTQCQLNDKVIFKGMFLPEELIQITTRAYIGINLVEPKGLNQFYSLANKFFDYIHAGIPQLTMNFIEYARINSEYEVAVLLSDPAPVKISTALNLLLENDVLYKELRENCIKAREIYNWQREEQVLLGFYNKIFN